MNARTLKRLAPVLRLAICAGLLYIIIRRLDLSQLRAVLAGTVNRWPWVAAGTLATFVGLVAGAVRWGEILAAQGLRLSFSRVFQVFFVGQFFNAFMLGACGGDMARAYYASKDAPGRRAEAVSTVFVDRAVGLFATILFCCVVIVLRIPFFLNNQGTRWPGILMFLFLIASVVGIFALFRRNLFEHWTFFRQLERDTRLGPLIRRTYDAFYLYRSHHRVMAIALVYSYLNLGFLTAACYCLGRSLQIHTSLLEYFTLFPIISVIAAIPITPGSLGVREGLFVSMFAAILVDAHQALALSLMVYAVSLVWSLFGGVFFIGRPLSAEIEELKQAPDRLRDVEGAPASTGLSDKQQEE